MGADKELTQDKIDYEDCVIAENGTVSAAVNLRGMTLCGIIVPSDFVGTVITFQMSDAIDGTYRIMQDGAGASVSKTVTLASPPASLYIKVDPADFAGVQFLKLVSGSSETGDDKTLKLALRQV